MITTKNGPVQREGGVLMVDPSGHFCRVAEGTPVKTGWRMATDVEVGAVGDKSKPAKASK